MTHADTGSDHKDSRPRIPTGISPGDLVEFVREHGNWFKKVAVIYGAKVDEVDDIVGETLAELHRRWAEVEHPRAYAKRVILNQVLALRRKQIRRPITVSLAQPDDGEEPCEPTRLDPMFDEIEMQLLVKYLADGLSSRQAAVFRLLVEGLSGPEIAAVMGGTPAAVRQHIRQMRVRMRELFPRGVHDLYGGKPARRQAP